MRRGGDGGKPWDAPETKGGVGQCEDGRFPDRGTTPLASADHGGHSSQALTGLPDQFY